MSEQPIIPPVLVQRWTVSFDLILVLKRGAKTNEIPDAMANLADVMFVQAEDGLYRLGSPDATDLEVEGPGDAPGYTITNDYLGSFMGHEGAVTVKQVEL